MAAAQLDVQSGGVTAEQVRSAEADMAAQQVSLTTARAKLEQASLKAPAAGTILAVGLKSGQPVQQGQLLFEIGGLNTLTVKVKVDEVDIGKVKVGQDLSVKNNAYPNDRFTGKVTRVAAAATAPDPKTGATGGSFYEVEGTVTNPDAKLRDGMSAEARVVTETRTQAMVVGLESIREEGEKAFALVVNDFKVELRPRDRSAIPLPVAHAARDLRPHPPHGGAASAYT
jgi:HlyD family secretion protein